MKVVYIPIGFQGAGKTTFCQWMQTHFPEMKYISLDRLQEIARENGHPHIEGHLAMKDTLSLVREIRSENLSIILDSWVIDRKFIELLQFIGFKVVCWSFKVPEATCLKRYRDREFPKIIKEMREDGIDSVNPNTIQESLFIFWTAANKTKQFPPKNIFDQTHLIFDEPLEELDPHDFLFQM